MPALLLAALLTWFFQVQPFRGFDPVEDALVFEAEIEAAQPGVATLFFDRGDGFRPSDSVRAKIAAGRQVARFLVPPEMWRAFRLYPLDQPAAVSVRMLRFVTLEGVDLHDLSGVRWRVAGRDEQPPGVIHLAAGRGVSLDWRPAVPLTLCPPTNWTAVLAQFAALALVAAALLVKLAPWWDERAAGWSARAARWREIAGAHPRTTLVAVAVGAVLLSSYPVVFFGRSFVSPNNRVTCLYDDFPTIPGGPAAPIDNPRGSDMGAMLWAHLPYSVIQHRSIFQDHEFPLWNRFNECGVTLLGQGMSMIGDPLHWITILAGGASWAWDAKFILAKVLFAFGIGLLVHSVARHLGIAALLGASSAFIGFFAYRYNHAAFFSLCYAPWILLGWQGIARGRGLPAALLLTVALGMEFHSGTAKEATMLIGGLSFAGVLGILLRRETWRLRLNKLALGAAAGVVFVLASAPSWMTFLDALRRAFTAYDTPHAWQIQPSQVIGLFEDLFYRQQVPGEMQTNPSANFLVLLGLLWAAANLRRLAADRTFLALGVAAVPPFALAFGVVPPGWIEKVPFLGNISHVDNTFSCVLIVLLFPLAGFGLRACAERFASREWRGDALVVLGLLAALLALYFGNAQALSRVEAGAVEPRPAPQFSAFFLGYAPLLLVSIAVLPFAARRLFHERRDVFAAALVAFVALGALHFRHGMYLTTKFDGYVMNPQPRLDLAATSPAIDFVIAQQQGVPARVAGLGGVLVPGFNVLYGLEHFSGPDAVLNRHYRELLDAFQIPMHGAWRHFVSPLLHPAYDLLGVRWLLGDPKDRQRDVSGLRRRAVSNTLEVFESPTAWPRAFFTDRLSTYETAADFARMVSASDGRPFAAMQSAGPGIARDWSLPADQPARRIVEAQNYRLTSNRTAFEIETPGPGLVVLGEAWLEGDLRVTVDRQIVPYVRVNHAFRGVWIGSSGPHRVEFSYRPRVLRPAVWCAVLGLVLLGGAVAVVLRRGVME